MNGRDGLQVLREQIAKEQVSRIRHEFERRGTAVRTAAGRGDTAYLYAAGQILVRADSVAPVLNIIREVVAPGEPEEVIPGVSLIRYGSRHHDQAVPGVLDVLGRIEDELGTERGYGAEPERGAERERGRVVAGPNHVVTVAPEAGPCPATEPEEVYFDIEPFPGVRMEDDGSDGSGVRIYIADTGLLASTTSHPWLHQVKGAADPLDPEPGKVIQPYAGHGTFVAAVARCMAPKAHVYVSNVFKTAGSALETDFVQDLYAAFSQNQGQGFDIYNLSVTTPSKGDLVMIGFEGWRDLLVQQHPDAVCVVAAGNDGKHGKFWPAAYPEMVSVGALAADWRSRATFSNYGDWVKVYAPGRDLVNAYATGIYECHDAPYTGQLRRFYGMAKWSGTSFSTPMVAGLIAARKSRTGLTARKAADSLLADAGTQAIPHIGPVLLPYGNQFTI